MDLLSGGIDCWYVDESSDAKHFAIVAMSVPLLRPSNGGGWAIAWDDEFKKAKAYRKELRKVHAIPATKELHSVDLVSGRGNYRQGKHRFGKTAASYVYKWMLQKLDFLQDASVITVVGHSSSKLYGYTKLEAALYALLQRMQRASLANKRNGIVFFDEGHGEYRTLYRKARVHLPTGSMMGGWGAASSKNIPMNHFFKDANFKQSDYSHFIQLTDLIAYAALLRVRADKGGLTPWQQQLNLGGVYDQIPKRVLNLHASRRCPHGLGIVWL